MERRFKSSDWLIIGAAAVMLVASVLPWWRLRVDAALTYTFDAWDFPNTGRLPVIVLVVLAAVTLIIRTESLALPTWLIHPYAVSAAVLVIAVLVGDRFFDSGYDDGLTRGLGLYLAAVAVLTAIGGCVIAIRDHRRGELVPTGDEDAEAPPASEENRRHERFDDDDDDDLAARYNAAMGSGELPVQRPRDSAPRRATTTRRTSTPREPLPRRRAARTADTPPPERPRRRPRGAPPP